MNKQQTDQTREKGGQDGAQGLSQHEQAQQAAIRINNRCNFPIATYYKSRGLWRIYKPDIVAWEATDAQVIELDRNTPLTPPTD